MNIQNALDSLKTNGGFSYNIQTGELNPSKGYMVAVSKDTEVIISHYQKLSSDSVENAIKDYILSHADKLADNNVFLGAWVALGGLYLDISQRVDGRKIAIALCEDREQLAYYDNAKKDTVYLADLRLRPTTQKGTTQTGKIPNSVGFSRMSGVTHRR